MAEGRDEPRQRVVRVPGSRRAHLTPVEGTDPAPEVPESAAPRHSVAGDRKGPNDEQLLRDVPPHY